jgi:inner membrane protein
MDNVTHLVAGLAIGEAAVQLRRRRTRRDPSDGFRTAAAVAGAVAANLPDADLLYTAVAGDKISYLLHHRGHTHTVVAGAAGALLAWAAAVALWRRRARRRGTAPPDAADRRWLLGAIAVAVGSHLVLDWTNDYGVHPFWPADVAWRYGDAVFIVEPWLWAAAVPALLLAARRRAARAGLALVLAAGLALAWLLPSCRGGAAAALTAGAAASLAAARRLAPGAPRGVRVRRLGGRRAGVLRRHARRAAPRRGRARATDPGARLADVVLTPGPANPFCANVIVVEAAGPGGGDYRLTTAWAAAAPALVPADRCRPAALARGSRSLPMAPSPRPASAAVGWDRTWQAPLAELRALARGNCQAAAVLRFARAPFWLPVDSAASTWAICATRAAPTSGSRRWSCRRARGRARGRSRRGGPRGPTSSAASSPARPPRGEPAGARRPRTRGGAGHRPAPPPCHGRRALRQGVTRRACARPSRGCPAASPSAGPPCPRPAASCRP